MFERISDRRLSRHGSNIITSEERRMIGRRSNSQAYETAVVVDFVSNPVNFLSERVETVITKPAASLGKRFGFGNKIKDKIHRWIKEKE